MFSKLAVPCSTSPSTTTGDALICAKGWVSVSTFHSSRPVARSRRWSVWPAAANTASSVTAGAATNEPPGDVLHRSLPVAASTAWTAPLQSSKYAVPPATTGVPVTPTRPSTDQVGRRRATLERESAGSRGLSRELAASWPYTGQSSRRPESACEPFAVVVVVCEVVDAAPPDPPE